MRLPLLPAALLLAGSAVVFGPPQAAANSNVKVSRFWHNHQPIYWPEWNSNWNGQPNRVQFARDSMTLKAGQVYDSGQPHPDNDLDQIFSVDDRKKAYQDGPKDSLAKVGQNGGYAISYSGSLINNVHGLGRSGYNGYSSGWWDGNRTARTWTTPAGSRRLDLVGFTYHHSLASVLPKSVFRKEIQIFHEAAYKAWSTGSVTNRSKGFFPTEMAFSRHMIDVLADEGYQWVIVASHHLSRTLPGYMGSSYTTPQANSWQIFSSPPNKADQINSVSGGGWWFGTGNVGETAYNHAPFAYQLQRAKYVNPETGAEKTIIMVPSDDIQSYKAGYSGWQKQLIDENISPHATDPARPCIVLPSTDGDNAWGGGNDSWQINAPAFMNNGTYPGVAIQDFVNQFGGAAPVVHMEDGAWIFPESCYGSPQFLKWVEPPAGGQTNSRVPNTQVDMETPGFTPKFYSWAPVMAGANWCETAEQMWTDENGAGGVQAWKIQDPYDNLGATDPAYSNPNIVERAWHIYLAGLDSGFNYYGGEGNDDEVKTSLATRRAHEMLQSYVEARKATNDRTPPTVFKPQRFPYNPGGYTFGWFNITPGNGNALKKMNSEFYIWTHAYDVSGITNIVAKVRLDNDGTNPLASNQNETYAGGAELGSWVSIPMTKRVLPQTAAALTAAANNSKITYFEGARSPVVADYYFARIDNSSLPNFRGKLVDYYIEATDTRGNVSKSDIQHVFVEDDGQTPVAPAKVTGASAAGLTTNSIRIAWPAVSGATGYKVFRGAVQVGNPAGLSFDDTGLAEDASYSYTVVANNSVGDGPVSDAVTGRTLAFIDSNPTALVVTAPVGPTGVDSNVTTFSFTGQAGPLLTNGINWTNLLTGQSGSFARLRDWSLDVPLGTGTNNVVFSAAYAINGTQTNAFDSPTNASYTGGWSNGSTGGAGFGPWTLTSTGSAGQFLADNPTNLSTGLSKGFGLWANGGGVSTARRDLGANLAVGGRFNLRFDNNWIDPGGVVGFALADSGGTSRISFYFTGGQANYRVSDAVTNRDTGIAYSSTGLDVVFELTASNAYALTVGTNNLSGTLASGGPLARLVVSNSSAGPNTERNLYLGAMSVTSLVNSNGTTTTNAPPLIRAASSGLTDGIPDDWWDDFFPDSADWVASADPDNDSFPNGAEHALGTDPADPTSRFTVRQAVHDGSAASITWSSVAGKKYRLQARPSLATGSWLDVGEEITATGPTASATHAATGQHFYRVRLVP